MGRRTGLNVPVEMYECCESEEMEESRYTQRAGWGDRARSHDELAAAKIRDPLLDEGVSFREEIY